MKKILLFSFLFLLLANCKTNDDQDAMAIDCTEVACTENFVTIILSVKDASGAAVALDRFEVLDKASSEDLSIELSDSAWQMARQNGQYPLYSDASVSGNENTERTLVFRAFINNEQVSEAEYIVAADCCHISLVSGDTNITIN